MTCARGADPATRSRRWRAAQDPSVSDHERFWEKVDRRGPDECWPWTGARSDNGYATATVGGQGVYAHRHMLRLALGREIAPGMVAMHSCDNPPCVNPAHLSEGTHSDNALDSYAKGRQPPAERRRLPPVQKLTDDQVVEIRTRFAEGASKIGLGREYGVSRRLIQFVMSGRRRTAAEHGRCRGLMDTDPETGDKGRAGR